MKLIFSLMICMTLLCISHVSYGSDVAQTTKTEMFTGDTPTIHTDGVVINVTDVASNLNEITVETNSDSPETLDVLYLMSTPLILKTEDRIPITEKGKVPYLDKNYTTSINPLDKPSTKAVLDSNHVGKLINDLNYNISAGNDNSYLPPVLLE